MARDSKVELLGQVPLFSRCSTKELKHIAGLVDQLTIPTGRTLTTQGRAGQEAFVIVDGEASVSVDGTEVGTVGPGAAVGEISLLDSTLNRTATVKAASDMEVLVIAPREFDALITKHPTVLKNIAAELARRLSAADHRSLS